MSLKEKKKYGQWSEEDMGSALKAYGAKKCSLNELCRNYNVPKATFLRRLNSKNKVATGSQKHFGRKTTFTSDIEKKLATHILHLEKMFFGVTIKDVRKAAFDLAEKYNMKHNFNREKKEAGKKWFYSFMRRHPNISLRQPESTSLARCKGFNRENVNQFFDLLEQIIDDYHLDATRIFNVDESGFATVAKKCQKILAEKGKRQVGSVASAERGINTTMVVCASAAGRFVCPMLIFKRKRMVQELGIGAPPNCRVEISDTGYVNSKLFVTWLKSFISEVKPTKDHKVLLVLDGHSTHSKNLEAIELARDNGVIILQLPGHTTHRLQPLDVAVFKPLELYYTEAHQKWLREYPGLKVSQYQVASLLGEAYPRAAVMATAMNGFRKCGIWPVDRNVFGDADFAPSEALTAKENISPNIEQITDNHTDSDASDEEVPLIFYKKTNPKHAYSKEIVDIESVSPTEDSTNVDITEILKTPVVTTTEKTRGGQKAEIITSTPYKDDLHSKQTPEIEKKVKTVKRQITVDIKTSSCSKKKHVNINTKEWHCKLCGECIVEDMIQCLKCRDWVHESCACLQSRIHFLCDFCK